MSEVGILANCQSESGFIRETPLKTVITHLAVAGWRIILSVENVAGFARLLGPAGRRRYHHRAEIGISRAAEERSGPSTPQNSTS